MPLAIAMTGIDKRFGSVQANDQVDFAVEKGTVHGLIGENGAGKSTLMSILYGFYAADSGAIEVAGKPVRIRRPADAIRCGLGMVHQHFMLVDAFSVLDNVMLGMKTGPFIGPARRRVRAMLEQFRADYGLAIDPDARIDTLSVGELQRVELLKCLVSGAETLILDEPTAVLTPGETARLFELVRRLSSEGRTIIIVTHKLKEIMAVTDRVSVMRRGRMVGTVETAKTSPDALAEMMVGRRVLLTVDKAEAKPGPIVLKVEGLSLRDRQGTLRLDKVGFDVRAGEIVGIAGVSGNGQSELLEILAGMRRPTEGRVLLDGEALDPGGIDDPEILRLKRVRHVPEDRHRHGLVKPFEMAESAVLGCTNERHLGIGPFLGRGRVIAECAERMAAYDVRPPEPMLSTALFSGGNQQKVVLAREIERDPRVLLVGQPTRGVDIGAIEFIHRRLVALRDAGKAIIAVSTELDEILALADRIVVLCGGRVIGERRPAETTEGELGLMMAGIAREPEQAA